MLIAATAAIIAEHGLTRVTVDAVAKAAGVTKGGLFHHFPSKQALIEGVADAMIASADAMIDRLIDEDTQAHGRFTRAFLTGVLDDDSASSFADQLGDVPMPVPQTLCLAMLADPALQARWSAWFDSRLARHADTDDNVSCAIVRLATDGIWLSTLQDADGPASLDPAIRHRLLELTVASP